VLETAEVDLARAAFDYPEIAAVARLDCVITAVEIRVEGDIDLTLFLDWLEELRKAHGERLFSVKGTMAVEEVDRRYVYRAVRAAAKGEYAEPWAEDEKRGCVLRVVGKDLDAGEVRASFAACLATEENYKRLVERLRFKLGDTVECNCGDCGWRAAEFRSRVPDARRGEASFLWADSVEARRSARPGAAGASSSTSTRSPTGSTRLASARPTRSSWIPACSSTAPRTPGTSSAARPAAARAACARA